MPQEIDKKTTQLETSSITQQSMDMICPICCKNFYSDATFEQFQEHVEKHFTEETYELL